ncbi:MAG: arginine repressor [Calditrichaceae bacterium]|jgi:transcriptional regulator of arginine metabolism
MSSKQVRQSKIKEIITSRKIASQEELLECLNDSGFNTTQATLSRDLHEIGIVRVPDESGFKYVFHQEETSQAIKQIIGMEIINVLNNENTIVVRTLPGRAQGVAIYLDRLPESNIIGTVAGDDAIIIIPDSVNNVGYVVGKIKEIMA